MPRKKYLGVKDLLAVNGALMWEPPESVDAGIAIQKTPAMVVVVLACKGEKVAVKIPVWKGQESIDELHDHAIALRAVADDMETERKARAARPVVDTAGMGRG